MTLSIPGHGGTDGGASGGNINEKDLTLQIAQYMYEQFKNKGVDVKLIRNTDETITPTERVNRILNAYGDKSNVVVISNHINSGSGTAEGAEVIYALRNNSTLADNILTALENAGQSVRKVYQRRLPSDTSKDYYFIHRNTGTTEPIIIEYGFIDNAEDLARIQSNYKKYVDAVVNAVIATKTGTIITPSVGEKTYVVNKGDTLYKIAAQYGTTITELKKLNNFTSNTLSIGQVLKIPSVSETTTSNTYTVKSGDTLFMGNNE